MNFEDETSLDTDSFTEEEEITAVLEPATCVSDLGFDADLDTKLLLAKLADMSRDVREIEESLTPVLDTPEEESFASEIEPANEEEEEEPSDDESILQRMENDSLSKLVLEKIAEMDVSDSNTSAFDKTMIVGDVDEETVIGCEKVLHSQVDYVFRDLEEPHKSFHFSGVHDLFSDVDDDYCIDCLFEECKPEDITRSQNIDDNSWCEAKCFAAEPDGGTSDVDLELLDLIGGEIEAIEFSTYVEQVCP